MSYKGVYLEGSSWLARIFANGKQIRLGRFASEEAAALAYDREAVRLHGDEADLNFPGDTVKEQRKTFGTNPVPVPQNWQALTYHPLACFVEFGAGVSLDRTVAFFREHGYDQDERIVLYRNTKGVYVILDGRLRHHASIQAGVTPSFCEYTGNDPLGYVMKKAFRAHLNPSQIALMLVKYGKEWATEWANANLPNGSDDANANLPKEPSAQQLSDMVGGAVSPRTITDAKKVDKKGTPELNQAVADGTLRVSDAAKIADETAGEQNQAVDAARTGKKRGTSPKKRKPSANGDHEEEVVDAEKMPVPPQAVAAFREAEELSSICHALDAAVARIKQAGKGAAARLVNVESVTQTVQNARKALWQSRPTHVCPYCAGKDKKCACCKGEGWTNTATYKQSPAGLQS